MAEFDPIPPNDAAEAAYARALLDDEAGREQRRLRLMAALPRPEAPAAVPVADNALAWRWQSYALGLLVMGLLALTFLALKPRAPEPRHEPDPRLAAAAPASEPVVVAQASPPVAAPPLVLAEAPRAVAKASPARQRAERSAPEVLADARQHKREAEVSAVIAEAARPAVAEPPPAVAPPIAAAPPAAPMVAAAPPPPKAVADMAPPQAEALARAEVSSGLAGRARAAAPAPAQVAQSLAASNAESAKPLTPANALLLAAVNQGELATARSALQGGASVHLRDIQGRTVLMLAARNGSHEMVELLLAAGARKADQDRQGLTAADHALAQGHETLVNTLR